MSANAASRKRRARKRKGTAKAAAAARKAARARDGERRLLAYDWLSARAWYKDVWVEFHPSNAHYGQ